MLQMEEQIRLVHKMNKQLVIRLGDCVKMKAKVVDEKNKTVGRIGRIFGPVSDPYGLVNLSEEVSEPEKLRLIC